MIELVIKIDEELYNDMKSLPFTTFAEDIIINGIPLPEYHGDLIDRDAIEVLRIGNIKREYDKGFDAGVSCMVNRILETPTIIEGSESE